MQTLATGQLSGNDLQELFFRVTGTSPADVMDFFAGR